MEARGRERDWEDPGLPGMGDMAWEVGGVVVEGREAILAWALSMACRSLGKDTMQGGG